MSKQRKNGYFWVKVLPNVSPHWTYFDEDKYYVAEWDGNQWYFSGYEIGLDYNAVKVFSKRFNPPPGPNEQPNDTATTD